MRKHGLSVFGQARVSAKGGGGNSGGLGGGVGGWCATPPPPHPPQLLKGALGAFLLSSACDGEGRPLGGRGYWTDPERNPLRWTLHVWSFVCFRQRLHTGHMPRATALLIVLRVVGGTHGGGGGTHGGPSAFSEGVGRRDALKWGVRRE